MLKRGASLAAIGVLVALTISGCGTLSNETEAKSKEALCASADASIESLRAGGTGAEAVASIIYDIADEEQVKDAAKQVRDGDTSEQAVDTLVTWMGKVC